MTTKFERLSARTYVSVATWLVSLLLVTSAAAVATDAVATADDGDTGNHAVAVVGASEHGSDPCAASEVRAFSDVASANVHSDGVACAVAIGLLHGSSEGRFAPESPLTRSQMASLVAGLIERSGGTLGAERMSFVDVHDGVHSAAIERLAGEGLVAGREGGSFEPSRPIRRDQFASILHQVLRDEFGIDAAPASTFEDVPAGSPHADSIARLASLSVISGAGATSFDPSGLVRRDQAATLLVKAYRLGLDAPEQPSDPPTGVPAPSDEATPDDETGSTAAAEGWAAALESGDEHRIRAWYEANTGVRGFYDPSLGRRLTFADLTVLDGKGDYIRTTHDGQVFEKLDIVNSRGLLIGHSDVTVRAVRITPANDDDHSITMVPTAGIENFTLEYVDIDGSGQTKNTGGTLWDVEARYVHLRGHRSGFHLGGGITMEYVYIHDQNITPGSHNTALSQHGGNNDVTIRRSLLEGSTSSALSLYPDRGPITNHTIEENVFIGKSGSYAVYGGCTTTKHYGEDNEGIRFVDNRFLPGLYGDAVWQCTGPAWGPGHEWSGNVRLDTGAPVD